MVFKQWSGLGNTEQVQSDRADHFVRPQLSCDPSVDQGQARGGKRLHVHDNTPRPRLTRGRKVRGWQRLLVVAER